MRMKGKKSDVRRFPGHINFMVYLSWSRFLLWFSGKTLERLSEQVVLIVQEFAKKLSQTITFRAPRGKQIKQMFNFAGL